MWCFHNGWNNELSPRGASRVMGSLPHRNEYISCLVYECIMDINTLLATGHIALWLLIAGLFFPRLALLVAWLGTGTYPPNTLPDLLNFVSWLFFPRFLMAYYIYTDMGTNNIWFWAYIVLGIAGFVGETGYARRRVVRRTTVSGDGTTTTTVEDVT